MIIKKSETFEVRLYIGSMFGYHGDNFTKEELKEEVGFIQKQFKEKYTFESGVIPVRMTQTEFISEDYSEKGWELAAINYPRFEKAESTITVFMYELARHLLVRFNQHRISLITPEETVLFEEEK